MKFDISQDYPQLGKFPLINYDDENYEEKNWRILGGIYISNFASTIIELNRQKISCFL